MKNEKFINRELSWLSFNYRVLQEAKDKKVPLYERIKFLAIYSSNLDEFFRVRVASLRALLDLKQKSQEELKFSPAELLKKIHKIVVQQQQEFGKIFREEIIPELGNNNIYLVNNNELNDDDIHFVTDYFRQNIIQFIQPILLVKNRIIPFLKNRQLYHAIRMVLNGKNDLEKKQIKHQYAIVEIPTDHHSRFVKLPSQENKHRYIFLDDIIRICLPEIFPAYKIQDVYSIKLTRDAELYIDDEFSGDLLNKIKKSINKRSTGVPSRFLYDEMMPKEFLNFLKISLNLTKDDMVAGGRYHNFNDFFSFPNPYSNKLEYSTISPIRDKGIDSHKNLFDAIKERDRFLYFPYHSYDYVVNLFEQVADDPLVSEINLTQYRVAKNSKIVKALIRASLAGKKVTAFVEVKARFDEESNIYWADEMEKAGVKVFYSFPGLKVHAKLALFKRIEEDKIVNYCYLGTGNFNENTAKIYTDMALLTNDKKLTIEVNKVFKYLTKKKVNFNFKYLLVAQFNMRDQFTELVDKEIENKKAGKAARIILKMNSLEDRKMINKLYSASKAGVKIDIIVRGICCLNPGVKGLSENITVTSIVDKYLEHSRFYIFHNNGKQKVYAASADWMKRNLSRRIEVAFPIYDQEIKNRILHIIDIQLTDNVKSRSIEKSGKLEYVKNNEKEIRSQEEVYNYLEKL